MICLSPRDIPHSSDLYAHLVWSFGKSMAALGERAPRAEDLDAGYLLLFIDDSTSGSFVPAARAAADALAGPSAGQILGIGDPLGDPVGERGVGRAHNLLALKHGLLMHALAETWQRPDSILGKQMAQRLPTEVRGLREYLMHVVLSLTLIARPG